MSSEVELKLAPERGQDENAIRTDSKLAFSIRQIYVAAYGPEAPPCVLIEKFAGNRYLEIRGPKRRGRRRRVWRTKLSHEAWQRIKSGKSVLRVRRSRAIKGRDRGEKFYSITVKKKKNGDVRRPEWEKPIPRWAFRMLWRHGVRSGRGRRPVRKRRYYIEEGGRVLHIDFYVRRLKRLVLIEIEFRRRRAAYRYRKENGRRGRHGLVYDSLPKCIRGRCLDVTHRKSAGCRTLSRYADRPRFW